MPGPGARRSAIIAARLLKYRQQMPTRDDVDHGIRYASRVQKLIRLSAICGQAISYSYRQLLGVLLSFAVKRSRLRRPVALPIKRRHLGEYIHVTSER